MANWKYELFFLQENINVNLNVTLSKIKEKNKVNSTEYKKISSCL